jgi:hypothetical protein
MTDYERLLARAYSLSERFSWLGITPDLPGMTMTELEAVCRLLVRIQAMAERCE